MPAASLRRQQAVVRRRGTTSVRKGECQDVQCWSSMRDPEIIETELMEIGAIADDTLKLERIIAWCASHPDEVPFALHQFMGRRDKHPSQTSENRQDTK